jgi:imidazolonepropionase-like amidohydrolase
VDVIVLDGDSLEDIGLLTDPGAHMALVLQAGAVVRQR